MCYEINSLSLLEGSTSSMTQFDCLGARERAEAYRKPTVLGSYLAHRKSTPLWVASLAKEMAGQPTLFTKYSIASERTKNPIDICLQIVMAPLRTHAKFWPEFSTHAHLYLSLSLSLPLSLSTQNSIQHYELIHIFVGFVSLILIRTCWHCDHLREMRPYFFCCSGQYCRSKITHGYVYTVQYVVCIGRKCMHGVTEGVHTD